MGLGRQLRNPKPVPAAALPLWLPWVPLSNPPWLCPGIAHPFLMATVLLWLQHIPGSLVCYCQGQECGSGPSSCPCTGLSLFCCPMITAHPACGQGKQQLLVIR